MANQMIATGLENVLIDVKKVKTESLFKQYINKETGQRDTIIQNTDNEYTVIGTLPNGRKKDFGRFSENYFLLSPKMVFESVQEWIETKKMPFTPKGYIDGSGNYQLRFIYDDGTDTKQLDQIFAGFKVSGSIGGGSKLSINGFLERLICTNGMATPIENEIFVKKVKHSKQRIHTLHGGINFDEIMPQVETFLNQFDLVKEHQEKLQNMELKENHVLPFFYEVTKGTHYPQSKFQDAYNRMQYEADKLGYTAMNRYLAYAGLNYVLEHDSAGLSIPKRDMIDSEISQRNESINIGFAVKNFKAIEKAETAKIEAYQAQNEGKNPRGKRKLLELDTVPMAELAEIYG